MNTVNKALLQFGLLTALLCSSALVLAQPADGQGGPRKPPPEAIEACKTLNAGQDCSFTAPHGAVQGSCWAPEGKQLACKPKDAPGEASRPKKP